MSRKIYPNILCIIKNLFWTLGRMTSKHCILSFVHFWTFLWSLETKACVHTLCDDLKLFSSVLFIQSFKKYLYHFVWPDQPLCSALSEYRYNIKPQCRAWSPFEQFTCAFLHPVPRHLSRDTPCNYKWEKKRNVFWLFPILIAYIYYSVC